MSQLVFHLIIITSFIFAEYSWEKSSADSLVNKGINSLYNYQFPQAIVYLDSALIKDPKNPIIPFLLLSARWLNVQINDGYSASYDIMISDTEHTIPIYKDMIKQYPHDPEYYLYLEPCPLCILQRVVVLLLGLNALIAFIHAPRTRVRWVYAIHINKLVYILALSSLIEPRTAFFKSSGLSTFPRLASRTNRAALLTFSHQSITRSSSPLSWSPSKFFGSRLFR